MKLNKSIMLGSLLLLLFLSIGMATANENTTIESEGINVEQDLGDFDDNYNANMGIEQINYIDDYFDINLKVNDEQGENIVDANVFLDDSKNADRIDENGIYHFHINTNGIHNFTLDDGKYRAFPLSININPPVDLNQNNGADEVDDDDGLEKITLVSQNITMYYDEITAEIIVYALDKNDNYIEGLTILMDGEDVMDCYEDDGYVFSVDYLPAGKNYMEFTLDDDKYKADPLLVEVNVLKATPTVFAKKCHSTQKQYVTLRADIENEDCTDWIYEGTVTFQINGKSYDVKVEDGEAVKKIKIKPGTYKYTATFKSGNYHTKTASSKVHVYSTSKKARTFNIKGYKIVLPLSKYTKLVNAKNKNKLVYFEIKTNKYVKQNVGNTKTTSKWVLYKKDVYPSSYYYAHKSMYKIKNIRKIWFNDGVYDLVADIYKKVTTIEKITKTVDARVSLSISYGGKNGGQTAPPGKYCLYVTTPYQNPGYDICHPGVYGKKISSEIDKLNKAKTKNR